MSAARTCPVLCVSPFGWDLTGLSLPAQPCGVFPYELQEYLVLTAFSSTVLFKPPRRRSLPHLRPRRGRTEMFRPCRQNTDPPSFSFARQTPFCQIRDFLMCGPQVGAIWRASAKVAICSCSAGQERDVAVGNMPLSEELVSQEQGHIPKHREAPRYVFQHVACVGEQSASNSWRTSHRLRKSVYLQQASQGGGGFATMQ